MAKTEEMDAIGRPCTLRDEIIEYFSHDLKSRRWIRSLDDFTKWIKGRVPLKGLFVEIWNPVGRHSVSLANLGEWARLLFRGAQCENGCLWKTERSTKFCKGCMTVPWGVGVLSLDREIRG